MILNTWIEADVKGCNKCGESHADLRFDIVMFWGDRTKDFYALCPKTSQPLVITIDDKGIGDSVGLTKVPTRPNIDDI